MGAGDLNSEPHACTAGLLLTEVSPWTQMWSFEWFAVTVTTASKADTFDEKLGTRPPEVDTKFHMLK